MPFVPGKCLEVNSGQGSHTDPHTRKHACGGDAKLESGLFCDLIAVHCVLLCGSRTSVQLGDEFVVELNHLEFWQLSAVSKSAEIKAKMC